MAAANSLGNNRRNLGDLTDEGVDLLAPLTERPEPEPNDGWESPQVAFEGSNRLIVYRPISYVLRCYASALGVVFHI